MTGKMKSKNYMGVLVVNHYLAEKPVDCVGSQLPSPSITEVAMYSASRNTDTGEVVRGELISKVRMSDLQFGAMIGNPNSGEGQLVTIESLSRFNVLPIDKNEDPAEDELKFEMSNLLKGGGHGQVSRFFDEMLERGETIINRGRMTKTDETEINKYLGMLSTYVKISEDYSLNSINKIAAKRVNEAKSSIHNTIRNAYRIGGEPIKAIESHVEGSDALPSLGAAGFMSANLGGNTSMKLFDDINMTHSVVSISLSSAVLRPPCDIINEPTYRKEMSLVDVHMSPEQYARFVRADKMEVPCTITRLYADTIDDFDSEDSRDIKFESSVGKDELYSIYLDKVADISKRMDAGDFKGKTGMREFVSMLKAAQTAYEEHLAGSGDKKTQAVSDVFNFHQKEVVSFFQEEVKALPEGSRKQIMKPLEGIIPKVNLLKNTEK